MPPRPPRTNVASARRPKGVRLRRADAVADRAFLRALYGAVRAFERALDPCWSDAAWESFLDMQFEAQTKAYFRRDIYPAPVFEIIEIDGRDAGRLFVNWGADELRVVDIALMDWARNRGIGGALLTALQDKAAATGRIVSIHVEKMNPAYRLYDRLGFVKAADREVYDLLQWAPRHSGAAATPKDQVNTA